MSMNEPALVMPDLPMDRDIAPVEGNVRFGTDAHKALFCRMLLSSFDPYKPAVIDWPALAEDARNRLTGLPIWDIAVQTEGRAGLNVESYGDTVSDPLLRRAVKLNAFEEKRHKHVLSNLVQAYGINLAPEPEYLRPSDPEWAFMRTGYSECIDSFFAFGLFETAKRSCYFPEALVETFEPVIQEEGRHILFFVNWAAWHRRNLPWWRQVRFLARTAAIWACLIWERIAIARDLDHGVQDNNFTVNGAREVGVDLSLRELLKICVAENDRRLGAYDPRLRRPRVVPLLARIALRLMGEGKSQSAGA